MVGLGHKSLPPTDLGLLDDKEASPGVIGNGCHNFEPRSSDEDEMAGTFFKLLRQANGNILSHDRFNVHQTLYTASLQGGTRAHTHHTPATSSRP
ncbi:hypothetical protein TNCV_4226711 [Trichonephila clavipes]|nr:hypothetical protein TNCV_4226711 [Trichonephila clavipes]